MTQLRDRDTAQQKREARYRNWEDVADEDDVDEPDAYTDLIQRDPVVCDTCFLYRYDVFACEWYRGDLGWMDYEKWDAIPERSEPVPRDEPSQGMQLVCKNCGTSGEKRRPIPAHLIDEYAANLSSTLRSKGISHDRDVLLSTVLRRNDDSELQGKQDSHVFGPAVEAAIRATN